MVDMKAALKSLNKPDLIKLVLQLESEIISDINGLTSEISGLVTQTEKVKDDVAIVKNVNELISYMRQSGSVGPKRSTQGESVSKCLLEANVSKVFGHLDMSSSER